MGTGVAGGASVHLRPPVFTVVSVILYSTRSAVFCDAHFVYFSSSPRKTFQSLIFTSFPSSNDSSISKPCLSFLGTISGLLCVPTAITLIQTNIILHLDRYIIAQLVSFLPFLLQRPSIHPSTLFYTFQSKFHYTSPPNTSMYIA